MTLNIFAGDEDMVSKSKLLSGTSQFMPRFKPGQQAFIHCDGMVVSCTVQERILVKRDSEMHIRHGVKPGTTLYKIVMPVTLGVVSETLHIYSSGLHKTMAAAEAERAQYRPERLKHMRAVARQNLTRTPAEWVKFDTDRRCGRKLSFSSPPAP